MRRDDAVGHGPRAGRLKGVLIDGCCVTMIVMKRLIFALLVAIGAVAGADPGARPVGADSAATVAAANGADAFLKTDALHVLHLKLSEKAWKDIQPTRQGLFSGMFATTHPANWEKPHESPFGYQYAFVHASLEMGGKTYEDIGLRFKGNSSYLTGKDLKKPFKVSFNHYDEEQSLAGLTEINLNNNAMDGTLMREALSYEFFRDAGVPASRTASALVYVSVEKLQERKLAGLYTVVEEIDKGFLKTHFGSAKGLLLKPENALNLPYQGETFDKYEKVYRPKSKATPEMGKRFVEFIKLIHQADDATFEKKIGEYLDVPGFLKFIAANAMLANMDSFLSTGHNFYLYMDPDTRKLHFIPWDLNLSFGTFDWVGTTLDQTDLSLRQPYVKPNRLTERVMSIDRYAKAYKEESARISKTLLTTERMTRRIAELEAVVAQAEQIAGVKHKAPTTNRTPEWDLRIFLGKRVASVNEQVAGTSEGYAPHWSKGFFGGGKEKAATRPATQPVNKNVISPDDAKKAMTTAKTEKAAKPVTHFDAQAVAAAFAKGNLLFDGKDANFRVLTAHRTEAGQVEVHTLDTDVIYVVEGEATFVTGGTSVDQKETGPNEFRGSRIEGGTDRKLSKGDVIIVPPGTPHWFKEVRGEFLYFVVKVR